MITLPSVAEFAIAESRGSAPPVSGFDIRETLISQYANSPVILELILYYAQWIDPTSNFDDFYDNIWNVDTAVGIGLDIWGRIVGVSRVLKLPTDQDYFGFSEASDAQPFNQGTFYGGLQSTSNFSLSDTAYRRLILAKALANISDGSIPSINQILINLFPQYGNCYVTDGRNMTMTYTFGATLSPVDFAIVTQSGVLPRPAGVSATYIQL